jgi:hypothetical protein
MAVFTLNPFNTVGLAAATATQLTIAVSGHWNLTLLNVGTAAVYVKNAATVAAADPASFSLPPNIPMNLVIWGPTGVWVLSTAAGTVSALLQPRDQ